MIQWLKKKSLEWEDRRAVETAKEGAVSLHVRPRGPEEAIAYHKAPLSTGWNQRNAETSEDNRLSKVQGSEKFTFQLRVAVPASFMLTYTRVILEEGTSVENTPPDWPMGKLVVLLLD